MKKVIYTAIFGDYDNLKDPYVLNPDFDYICFTDNKSLKSGIWKFIYTDSKATSIILARMYKILPHIYLKDYNVSIWVDGQIRIIGDMNKFLAAMGNANIMLFNHTGRNCIYNEAEACIRHRKDSFDTIKKQVARYKKEGFPKDKGLVATGMMVRKHKNKHIKSLMNIWWGEISKGSIRDQLSFNYALWKYPVPLRLLDWHKTLRSYFKLEGHQKVYRHGH